MVRNFASTGQWAYHMPHLWYKFRFVTLCNLVDVDKSENDFLFLFSYPDPSVEVYEPDFTVTGYELTDDINEDDFSVTLIKTKLLSIS